MNMTNQMPDERIRMLNEIALNAGKNYLSKQTDYLHFCYHQGEEENHLTIPLYENFLYAYALLKSKKIENVAESKKKLLKLLHFQSESGNFPIYLHEYPNCNERLFGIQLLLVFYHIFSDYGYILGDELSSKLCIASTKLLEFCIQSYKEKQTTSLTQLALGTLTHVYGNRFESQKFIHESENFFKDLHFDTFSLDWCTPEARGLILNLFQLKNSPLSSETWRNFWSYLENTYDFSTASYVGPAINCFQNKYEPEISVVDYHYAAITGLLPERLQKNDFCELQACLVQPYDRTFASIDSCQDEVTNEISWGYKKNNDFSLSYIQTPLNKEDPRWKGIIPFKICWGDLAHLFSFVAQDGNYQTIKMTRQQSSILLEYELSEEFDFEHKELKEMICSIDQSPQTEIFVNNAKATTFHLNDSVIIQSKKIKLTLNFSLIEGSGDFLGHIIPGNRISQLALKNQNRFNAYDNQIYLRTLRRSKNCRVGLKINIEEG